MYTGQDHRGRGGGRELSQVVLSLPTGLRALLCFAQETYQDTHKRSRVFTYFALSCHTLLYSFLVSQGVISLWKPPHPGGTACYLLCAPLSSHLLSQVSAILVD